MSVQKPTHPALDHPTIRALMGPRDRAVGVPASASAEEGLLLERRLSSGLLHGSFHRAPRDEKLLVLRLQWFGWLEGQGWLSAGKTTDAGRSALQRHLEAADAAGDAVAGVRRRRLFPTGEEEARRRRVKRLGEVWDDAAYAMRDRQWEIASQIRHQEAIIESCGLEIAKGSNELDLLSARMRDAYLEKTALEQITEELNPERKARFAREERLRALLQRLYLGEKVDVTEDELIDLPELGQKGAA